MKKQFSQLMQSAQKAGNTLKEKAANAGQAAVDKSLEVFESWLEEVPRIESYGLKVTNFNLVAKLSPALEAELTGTHKQFTPEKLAAILEENKPTSLTGMVYKAIKATYDLHEKISDVKKDPLIVKVRISLSPEISVYIGQPLIS